jgi:hypothetical protein
MGNPRPRTAVMGWRCANINRLWPPAPGHADLLDSIQCHCYPCAVLLCRAAGSCVITLNLIDRLRSWAIHTRAGGNITVQIWCAGVTALSWPGRKLTRQLHG